jgi:hypothetical protein
MDFGLLPPEINSGRMYSGAGSGPMLAASAAWDGLAAELGSTALMLLYPSNGKFDGLRVRVQWAHQSPDFAGQ